MHKKWKEDKEFKNHILRKGVLRIWEHSKKEQWITYEQLLDEDEKKNLNIKSREKLLQRSPMVNVWQMLTADLRWRN